ncbi:MAG: response regulator transcription factor [Clostridia bacterium]|nr:response regulator transcription factor [Clostridia bacterium]
MLSILMVEDEREMREQLCDLLAKNGYAVVAADGQRQAVDLLEEGDHGYDLALVDLMLRDGHGTIVCSLAKEKNIPVVFMTAYDDEATATQCLKMGADYVQKNRPQELLARIRSALAKVGKTETQLVYRDLRIDTEKALAYKNDEVLDLGAMGYRLLCLFMRNVGKMITVDRMINEIWNYSNGYLDYISPERVRQTIHRVRKEIEDDPKNPQYIVTVHGLNGYKFGE